MTKHRTARNFTLASIVSLLIALAAHGQTFPNYTQTHLESFAPLAWQASLDSASRLTIGNDDGNASAAPHSSAWAVVNRHGGADGLRGLIDEFKITTEGAPRAFGIRRRGCSISNEATLNQCMLARWETVTPGEIRAVIVEAGTGNIIRELIVSNVSVGDVFSIERDGDLTINFYRSGSAPFERLFLASFASPFLLDGQSGTPREVSAAFEPSASTRKIADGQEGYYCCPWQ